MLGTCGVKNLVAFLVIGFLKQNVCSDSCILELAVIVNRCCGNVDIYSSDCAVLVLYGINRLDTVQNVLNRIVACTLSYAVRHSARFCGGAFLP